MKISTKGRYGLKAMLDLAVNSLGDQVTLKNIAQRQGISENYLEQVFSILRKAELVKSIKGPQGGYILGRETSDITAGEILRTLEGSLSVNDGSDGDIHDQYEYCLLNCVWQRIDDSINSTVDSITLEGLAAEYRKIAEGSSYTYYI